jgi:Na+-transporting methylmalonyl-CoA/oxaloacetate decarboxylase gamma subunit
MNTMIIALQITALGMGLVFAAIILLWWMMNMLTFLTTDTKLESHVSETPSQLSEGFTEDELKVQAVAVAVAMAVAEQQGSASHLFVEPSPVIVSAWQLGMRTRQMYQKGSSMRRRAK